MIKVNPRKIFKNTTLLATANIINLLGSFVLTFFIARQLQVLGFGIYSTIFLFLSMTAIISALGLGGYITRELARNLELTNRYFIHGTIIAFFASLIVAAILWVAIPFFGYAETTVLGIRLIAFSLLPASFSIVSETIFITHQRTEFALISNFVEMGGKIVISLLLLFSGYGVIPLIIVFIIFRYIAAFCEWYFLFRHIFRPQWEFDLPFAMTIVKGLGPFALLQILTGSFDQIEIVFLSVMHNETAVGVYAAAFKLITLWHILPSNLMQVIFPLMSQAYTQSAEQFHKLQEQAVKYLLALAFPLAAGTIACANLIIHFFYGEGYGASVLTLQILGLMIIITFIEEVMWRILVACDQENVALKAQVIGIIGRIIFSFLLIPSGSYIGTAWTLVIAFGLHTVVHMYFVQQVGNKIPYLRLSWRFAVAALGMGLVLSLTIPYLNINPVVDLFAAVAIGVLVYPILAFGLKAVTPEDIDIVKRILRPPPAEEEGSKEEETYPTPY